MPEAEVTRILSIDGGGIRGIIPAMVLSELEHRADKPIAQLFDVVAGTSTGGILALGVACPDEAGTAPKYSADQLVELYAEDGPAIFPHEFLQNVRQLLDPKYGVKGIESVLERHFKDARLSQARVDVLVPAYDLERRQPLFFRSAPARHDATYDFAMRSVARATSAAPTYFRPLHLPAPGAQDHYTLVDGGVAVNDPAMAAYVDRWAGQAAPPENLMIVSLGTGSQQTPYTYKDAKGWGLIEWARPVFNIALDAGPEVTQYQLHQILGPNYHRLQTPLTAGHETLDDTEPANIRALRSLGRQLIDDNSAKIDDICGQLINPQARKPVPPPAPGIRAAGQPLRRD